MPSIQTHRNANGHRGISSGYSSVRFTIIAGIFTLLLIVGAAMLQFTGFVNVHAARVSAPNVVTGTIPPLVARSYLIGPTDSRQILSLSLGFHPQHEAALNSYVQNIYRRGSANSHRYLTPAQFAGIYAPSKTNYDAVTSLIKAAGFTVTDTYIQRLLIGFEGTVAQAEQAFHVSINNYRAPDGRIYFANASDPVLPAWTAGIVQGVNGLNNAENYVHAPIAGKAVVKQSQVTPDSAATCPTAAAGYWLPSQLATAYNLQGLYDAGFQGEGQTIALFELAGYVPSDLTTYVNCFSSRKAPVQGIVVGSGPIAMDSGVAEVELDAEVILSAAPQLGNLKIYQSSQTDYLNQWAQIVNDAVPVVSTSWGLCEQLSSPAVMTQENTLFTTAAAQGQTIFAASGDSGSADCFHSNPALTGLGVDDPASQPYVTGVGGTSLTASGSIAGGTSITPKAIAYSETTWNTPGTGASGGGVSTIWSQPSWQAAPGVTNIGTCATPPCREVPDVSLNADPSHGYLVYCTLPAACGASSTWRTFGGTSAAAPMWAAWMALTNDYSIQNEGFNLGFLNPVLYADASVPVRYAADFHDITTGNNDYTGILPVKYAAGTGYDMATGLGSYNGYNLANQLEDPTNRDYPASNKWYFAEGSVGGGFQEYLTLFNPSPYYVATVNVTYIFDYRAPVVVKHEIAGGTRLTVNVNDDLGIQVTDPQQAISTIVTSVDGLKDGVEPVVAERPMYFNYKGISSGTDTLGIDTPATSFDFPLVDSRQSSGHTYYSYITMLNPSPTATAAVTATYYTGTCGTGSQAACPTQTVSIPPMQRATLSPLALGLRQQMSVNVTSTGATPVPIAVERPMYISDTIPTAGGLTTGATTTVGSVPANDWLFAEGYTGTNFQEDLVLSNFSTTTTAAATIKLEYANGTSQTVVVNVPALGQTFFDVNNAFSNPAGGCACTPTTTVSAEVTSGVNPIVAERLMYFHQGSAKLSGVTEVVGEISGGQDTYLFSEGYTTNGYNEYLTLQNPTNLDETVAVTLFVDTYVFEEQVIVKAFSRYTLSINALVVPIVKAHLNMGSNSYDVSLLVQALPTVTVSDPVVIAERPMYFNYRGMQGGTDIIGYATDVA